MSSLTSMRHQRGRLQATTSRRRDASGRRTIAIRQPGGGAHDVAIDSANTPSCRFRRPTDRLIGGLAELTPSARRAKPYQIAGIGDQ